MDVNHQPNPVTAAEAEHKEKRKKSAQINPQYKDRVIRRLFGESKENALSLYNAVNGSAYTNPDDLEFDMIEDMLYMGMRNDISFILGTELNLYEHQSTMCPNMPYRGIRYLLKVLDGYVHMKGLNMYGGKLQKLPTPDYVVLYNGEKEMPDFQEQRLTDAFEQPDRSCVEMKAKVYNINYGRNADLMAKCEPLRGYAILVDKIRQYQKGGMTIEEAADRAVDECIREEILLEFLAKHKAEVVDMFLTEYDEAERLRLEKKESLEEGIAIGEKRGIEIGERRATTNSMVASIQNLVRNLGMTVDAAITALGIPAEERQKYASLARQQRMPDT